jgi:uncharacterized protein (TIGR02231 family)
VVPRASLAAWLVAKGTWKAGWPLLPGEVASFLDGAFVGTSQLPLVGSGDEVRLGFGTDDALKVESVRVEAMTSAPTLGRVTATRTWRYTVTSGRKSPVNVEIVDRLPRATTSKYKVRPLGDAPDEQDDQGIVTWRRTIPPGQATTVTFGYDVRYPATSPPGEVE